MTVSNMSPQQKYTWSLSFSKKHGKRPKDKTAPKNKSAIRTKPNRRWKWNKVGRHAGNGFVIALGSFLIGLGYALFQVPHNIAAGGISGIGIIINHFTGWPMGAMYLVMNLPLLVLGFFHLGRWWFVLRTMLAVVLFSVSTDVLLVWLPRALDQFPISNDVLLCSVYAGILAGVGGGIIYHAGATIGGTAIVGRILQIKTGMPLSQLYLYTDGAIVLLAGIIFGWEISLYAMLTLILAGMAADYTLEGPSSIRVASIVTNRPEPLMRALMEGLYRGVTSWEIVGGYTGEKRTMLMCTVFRPQVHDLKRIIAHEDPDAFVTIASGYQAVGQGFLRPKIRK